MVSSVDRLGRVAVDCCRYLLYVWVVEMALKSGHRRYCPSRGLSAHLDPRAGRDRVGSKKMQPSRKDVERTNSKHSAKYEWRD